jgi:hypothetical protein
MLHDLKCTEENPATYENILRQSQKMESPQPAPYNQESSSRFSNSMRRSNGDGTSSEFRKSINMNGDEEIIETRYDPEGNIISRKRAGNLGTYIPQNNNYQEVSEFYEYEDDNANNYINNDVEEAYYVEPNVGVSNNQQIVYHTAEAQEIVYEAPAKYDPNITINQPIQQTIINSDVNLSDNIMNDIIRSTMRQAGNKNISIQINNSNIGNNIDNMNDITTYNYNQTNIINNISNDAFNQNLNLNFNNLYNQDLNYNGLDFSNSNNYNNNVVDLNMNPEDVLRKTAGIGSHNYQNFNYHY